MDNMNLDDNGFENKESVSENERGTNSEASSDNVYNANPYTSNNEDGYNANPEVNQEEVSVPIETMPDSNYEARNYVSNENNENLSDQSQHTQGAADDRPHNSDEPNENARPASFYSESFKKPGRSKNVSVAQLVIVAVVSSMIGGAVVGSYFQFLAPAAQPSAKSFFSSLVGNKDKSSDNKNDNSGTVKKVEIVENADSPVSAIAEKVSPSIVGIRVTSKSKGFIFDMSQDSKSEGSGIIIKNDGYIMTNYHVVKDAISGSSNGAKIEVILPSKKDKPYDAQVIGGDEKTDLAVIKINEGNLPVAELGNSDNLKVGELAVAIGNPAGLEYMGSVTVGVISGLNRTIPVEDGKELKLIQTDAAINPGNSGGALLNSKGQVIGINTAKIGESGFEGLGFAIPVNKAKEITDSLMQFKYVKGRALLGIESDPNFNEDVAKQYDVPMGVLVAEVTPFTGAYKAGLKAGDIITKFDGKAVKSVSDINDLKAKHKPGDTVPVTIYRDGDTKTIQVQLSEDKGIITK